MAIASWFLHLTSNLLETVGWRNADRTCNSCNACKQQVLRPSNLNAQKSINITQLAPDQALPLHTRRLLRLNQEHLPDGKTDLTLWVPAPVVYVIYWNHCCVGSVSYSYLNYKEPRQYVVFAFPVQHLLNDFSQKVFASDSQVQWNTGQFSNNTNRTTKAEKLWTRRKWSPFLCHDPIHDHKQHASAATWTRSHWGGHLQDTHWSCAWAFAAASTRAFAKWRHLTIQSV